MFASQSTRLSRNTTQALKLPAPLGWPMGLQREKQPRGPAQLEAGSLLPTKLGQLLSSGRRLESLKADVKPYLEPRFHHHPLQSESPWRGPVHHSSMKALYDASVNGRC